MSAPGNKAVFLSYASQDAEDARRICEALRAAGVEVWFDQSELRGGDAWDAKIRKQIKECALFVPVISANTQARREGYFRIEWKLAAQRTHAIAEGTPFLVPVILDDIPEGQALVPGEFRDVQWTRLTNDRVASAFCAQVNALLAGGAGVSPAMSNREEKLPASPRKLRPVWLRRWPSLAFATLLLLAGGGLALSYFGGGSRKGAASEKPPTSTARGQISGGSPEVRQLLAKLDPIFEKQADATRDEWLLAEDMAAQFVKRDPQSAEGWAAYAQTALGLYAHYDDRDRDPLNDALSRARRALALAPDFDEARLALAMTYARRKNTEGEAEEMLRAIIQRQPRNARALEALAYVVKMKLPWKTDSFEFSAEIVDEVLSLLGRAADASVNATMALRAKASMLKVVGRFAEAEATLDQALAQRAGPAALVDKLEMVLCFHQDLARAAAMIDKAPGSYFLREDVCEIAARIWLWRREPDKCLKIVNGWKEDFLGSTPTRYFAGQAWLLRQRADLARPEWAHALRAVETQEAALGPASTRGALGWKPRLHALLDRATEAERELEEFRTKYGAKHRPLTQALIRLPLGNLDAAMADIDPQVITFARWNRLRWYFTQYNAELRFDPAWDPLREDPRFKDFMVRMNATLRRFEGAAQPSPGAEAEPIAAPDPKSIVVLPFKNLSADKEHESFSDALTENVRSTLARERDLRVVPRTSAFSFKGKDLPVAEIARALNVAQVVEGSVVRADNTVRILCSLTRLADGFASSDEFPPVNRELKNGADMFALQDEVASAVLQKLTLRRAVTASPVLSNNLAAVDAFLRGREFLHQTSPFWLKGIAAFEEAVRLDPKFALAWANLGRLSALRYARYDLVAKARAPRAIEEAFRLQPDLPEAHLARAEYLRTLHAPLAEVERALTEAEKLQLNDSDVVSFRARLEFLRGRNVSGLQLMQRAVDMDPRNGEKVNLLAIYLMALGRYAEAEAAFQRAYDILGTSIPRTNIAANLFLWKADRALVVRALDEVPENIRGYPYWDVRAAQLHGVGDFDGAMQAERRRVELLQPGDEWRPSIVARLQEARGDDAAARREYLAQLPAAEEKCTSFPELFGPHVELAMVHAGLGHEQAALAAARKAVELVRPQEYVRAAATYFRQAPLNVLAQVLARFGHVEEALRIVREQVELGNWRRNLLQQHPDWAILRKDPRFQEIAEKAPL